MSEFLALQFVAAIFIYPVFRNNGLRRLYFFINSIATVFVIAGWWIIPYSAFVLVSWWAIFIKRNMKAKLVVILFTISLWVLLKIQTQSSTLGLPIGFSYFAFLLISYLMLKLEKEESLTLRDFFSEILFFPILYSGPVMSASQVAKSFLEVNKNRNILRATLLLSLGLFKKGIGDHLSLLHTFDFSKDIAIDQAWLGVLAMHSRLYLDFSGYSDIAIALGILLEVEIPENFNLPFLAGTTTEFWRRWHMSLGEWIKMHFFMPAIAQFNKFKKFAPVSQRNYLRICLLFTMMIIAFWHGLSINFLIWGLINSFFLIFGDSVLGSINRS